MKLIHLITLLLCLNTPLSHTMHIDNDDSDGNYSHIGPAVVSTAITTIGSIGTVQGFVSIVDGIKELTAPDTHRNEDHRNHRMTNLNKVFRGALMTGLSLTAFVISALVIKNK